VNKKEMKLGTEYKLQYSSRQGRLLSFGGYAELRYSLHDGKPERRIRVRVYDPEERFLNQIRKPLNLVLSVNTDDEALIEASTHYRESDYLKGDPVPEGTLLVGVPSSQIEYPWSWHLSNVAEGERNRADAKLLSDHREKVTIPLVKAEFKRLGLSRYFTNREVIFTLEEFLELAARIPVEEK